VADLTGWQAAAISAAGLVLAWFLYDVACRLLPDDRAVAGFVTALVIASAWAAGELFAARAAFLQVGAMLGTIMAANVFFTIIPAHWELVRAKQEFREPDPEPGLRAKQRSVHNNYLTLPVVFTMLAGHFPLAFGGGRPWLVLLAIFAIVVAIRHFFNRWHTERREWWILGAAAAGAIALAIVLAPEDEATSGSTGATLAPTDAEALAITAARCQSCHIGASAPAGVRLETVDQLRTNAAGIHRQVSRNAMPPGNSTGMSTAEREILVAWAIAER
jgi:uncharacterized membrane protein